MNNIKQKILKFTLSFLCIFFITGCETTKPLAKKSAADNRFVEIALLLPLSGPDALSGAEYNKMIKAGLTDGAKTKIRITSYDSADREVLNESLDKIFDAGVDIIIGPIYSEATKIVADKVKSKGTIVLSLSNNPILADERTYIFGHAPMRQMEQLTDYFLKNNYKNYITLFPSNRHSKSVGEILKEIITANDSSLVKTEFYNNTPEEINNSLRSVTELVDNINENDFNLTRPVIILADDSAVVGSILKIAREYNLDKKAVIAGDNRIDADIGADVTFTGSKNFVDINLPAKAQSLGITHLSFIHVLAYDAGKIIGESIGPIYNKSSFLENMNNSTFIGASGAISFKDFIARRKYDIIRKKNNIYSYH